MTTLDEKIIDTSVLIEKQLPSFVRESSPKFVSFLTSYYESQEVKYNSLDIVENLINYYNKIGFIQDIYNPNYMEGNINNIIKSIQNNFSSGGKSKRQKLRKRKSKRKRLV